MGIPETPRTGSFQLLKSVLELVNKLSHFRMLVMFCHVSITMANSRELISKLMLPLRVLVVLNWKMVEL